LAVLRNDYAQSRVQQLFHPVDSKNSSAGEGLETLTGRLSLADFLTGYGFRRPNVTPVGAHDRFALKFSLSLLRMPFRYARARPRDCISIIGQILRDLYSM